MSRVEVSRLANGWWHVRGHGPCNWAQPPEWPCDETTLRRHAFPEASEPFIRAALALSESERRQKERKCKWCAQGWRLESGEHWVVKGIGKIAIKPCWAQS